MPTRPASRRLAPRARRRRRTYHHGDLPAALLDAADALVAERGPAGFSLREAARVVGVDPAACYRHFRDREAVLQGLARRGFTRLAAALGDAADAAAAAPPRDVLAALAQAYVAFALEHAPAFRVMFGPTGLDARDPRLRGDYRDGIGGYERLQRAVVAWAEEGGYAVDVDAATIALWSSAHGLACLFLDGAITVNNPLQRARMVDGVVATVLAGLAAPRVRVSGRAGRPRRRPRRPRARRGSARTRGPRPRSRATRTA